MAPRVCCQPLLLICTRRAGKKYKNFSLLPFSFLHWSLIFFPCYLFDPYLSWLSLSPHISALSSSTSFILSLTHISKCKLGKHALLLPEFCFWAFLKMHNWVVWRVMNKEWRPGHTRKWYHEINLCILAMYYMWTIVAGRPASPIVCCDFFAVLNAGVNWP